MNRKIKIITAVIVVLVLLFLAFSYFTNTAPCVGCDRDVHGCVGSAGYSWCEETQTCLRQWETQCEPNAYIACGCGCCGGRMSEAEFEASGVHVETRCIYHSKGDDINKIILADKEIAKDVYGTGPCKGHGCSMPVKYIYCD